MPANIATCSRGAALRKAVVDALHAAGEAGATPADVGSAVGMTAKMAAYYARTSGLCVRSQTKCSHLQRWWHEAFRAAAEAYSKRVLSTPRERIRFNPARVQQVAQAVCEAGEAGIKLRDVAAAIGLSAEVCRMAAAEAKKQGLIQRVFFSFGERKAYVVLLPPWAPKPKAQPRAPQQAKPRPKRAKKASAKKSTPKKVPRPVVATLAGAGAHGTADVQRSGTTAHQRFLSAQPIIPAGVNVVRGRDYPGDLRYTVERPTPVFSGLRPGQYPLATGSVLERVYGGAAA